MRVYFDSSVLIAALVQGEARHAESLRAFISSEEKLTSIHALAEVFATMTSGKLPIQFTPEEAEKSLRTNIIGKFEIIGFKTEDYMKAAADCGRVGARGGAFFDVLHLQAARLGKADSILTLNERHFRVFAQELQTLVSAPR